MKEKFYICPACSEQFYLEDSEDKHCVFCNHGDIKLINSIDDLDSLIDAYNGINNNNGNSSNDANINRNNGKEVKEYDIRTRRIQRRNKKVS